MKRIRVRRVCIWRLGVMRVGGMSVGVMRVGVMRVDKEAKLMTKLSPEWIRTSDTVIRSPARYRWTTAPA